MKRPEVHVMEDISEDIFKSFLPNEWIIRKIPKDYGVDYEIEIVEKDIVTGKRIWFQLKGTRRIDKRIKQIDIPENLKSEFKGIDKIEVEYISFQIDTKLLKYSINCDFPLLLGVVDINERNVYWLPLQDYILENLEFKRNDWRDLNSVTIHLPAENNLRDDNELSGLKWYSMEPARMRAFSIIHSYYHELGYEARLSGYEIGDGFVDQRDELISSIKTALKYLTLTLEQNSLFGENGVDVYIYSTKPLIVEGIEACYEILKQNEENSFSFEKTAILIGKVGHACNLLSTCISMYVDFRKRYLLDETKSIFRAF